MSDQFEFHKPSKTYKQVKSVNLNLPNRLGKHVLHRVMIYMSTAGTPDFAAGVPQEYVNAWRHKDAEAQFDNVPVIDNMVRARDFDTVVKHLLIVGDNYGRHASNLRMRKVIRLYVETKGVPGKRNHNDPSFSDARVLIGVRSAIQWEVNGGFYALRDRARRDGRLEHMEDLAEEDIEENVQFSDMHPTDMRGGDIVTIPYTKEAWETVVKVEESIVRAATMLLQLTDKEQAQALLQAGFQNLLSHDK